MVQGIARKALDQGSGFLRSLGLSSPLLWTLLLFGVVGCGDSGTDPEPSVEVFIENPVVGDLMVGDRTQFLATLSDPSAAGVISWSSSDTAVALVVSGGHLWAQRPGNATITATYKNATAETSVVVVPRPGGYTAPEIDYFQEIAFGFEYGSASEVIRKWAENPRIRVFGNPTAEDQAVVEGVVGELNQLMEEVQIELVTSGATVEVHFGPITSFPTILPSYVPGNWGYFSVWFDGQGAITRSVVLIATDVTDQDARSHLIREEVTQMLGLAKDSNHYSNSIFYSPWTTTHSYDPIDEALIEMLYRTETLKGLGYRDTVNRLRVMTRRGWAGASPGSALVHQPPLPAPTAGGRRVEGKGGVGSGG